MVFNCPVKYNGIDYPVGADVPIEDNKPTVENSAVGDTSEEEKMPKRKAKKNA